MASSCFIDAHVPPALDGLFEEEYFSMTGQTAKSGDVGFTKAIAAWGIAVRIRFSPRLLQMLPSLEAFFQITEVRDGTKVINSKAWAYELFESGFRIGRNHDVAIIRQSVPDEFKDAFDIGVESGQEAAVPVAVAVAA